MLRNRRTVIFTLILPAAFFFMFGTGQTRPPAAQRAYVLVSLGVYGAMIATTSGGAMVSIERAQGWSRQLRLTPLRPVAYIAIKVAHRDGARAGGRPRRVRHRRAPAASGAHG